MSHTNIESHSDKLGKFVLVLHGNKVIDKGLLLELRLTRYAYDYFTIASINDHFNPLMAITYPYPAHRLIRVNAK